MEDQESIELESVPVDCDAESRVRFRAETEARVYSGVDPLDQIKAQGEFLHEIRNRHYPVWIIILAWLFVTPFAGMWIHMAITGIVDSLSSGKDMPFNLLMGSMAVLGALLVIAYPVKMTYNALLCWRMNRKRITEGVRHG